MKTMKTLLAVAVTAAALVLGAAVQASPGWDNGTLTNTLSVISNATSTVVQSQPYWVSPGADLAVFPRFNGTGNTNIVFGFDVYDGQNWSTTQPLAATNSCNYGTNVTGMAIFTKAQLVGVQQIRWDYTQTTDFTNIQLYGIDYQSYHQ
jgi:hypothetical protein